MSLSSASPTTERPAAAAPMALPLALLALLALLAASASASPSPAPAALPTKAAQYGHDEGLAKAKAEGRQVMAYFWATWCVNCAWFNQNVLGDPRVVEKLESHFVLVPLDADVERELAARYLVRVVPTTIFLDPSGEPATILPGTAPADDFLKILDYLSSYAYLDMEYEDYDALGEAAPKPAPLGSLAAAAPPAAATALPPAAPGRPPLLIFAAGGMAAKAFFPSALHSLAAAGARLALGPGGLLGARPAAPEPAPWAPQGQKTPPPS